MLKIVAIKLNTISNSQNSSIQTLHTDLKCSTTQSTFKNISAGLNKNEEKDSNSSYASLFTSVCLGSAAQITQSNTPKNGCNARDKIWARFRRCCCGFLSTLYILQAIS